MSKPMKVIDISYEVYYSISMCDFIDYEIYDEHKIKNKLLEKQDLKVEEELEKVQEEPITVTQ
jgi:hypothetical protein